MQDFEVQDFTYGILDVLDTRVTELQYLVALDTDQMVVLLISVGLLKLGDVLTKLMLCHQVTFFQKVQSVVNRGPADAIVFVFHTDVESFYIKMSRPIIYLFQNGVPFRRFPQFLIFKVRRKDFFNLVELGRI